MDNSGKKHDQNKPPMSLIPHDALIEIAKVLDFGKQKYDAHNWKKGIEWSRVLDAAYRHMGEFNEGRRKDSETNLSHLAHAAVNLMFLLWYEKHRPEFDNLYTQFIPKCREDNKDFVLYTFDAGVDVSSQVLVSHLEMEQTLFVHDWKPGWKLEYSNDTKGLEPGKIRYNVIGEYIDEIK